jgi:hypothetical protein
VPLQQIHCELVADDKELITFDELRKKVKSAMGADYDMGSNSRESGGAGKSRGYKSQQSDIKAKAKAAYSTKEKETTIGAVVFDAGPLSKGMTACDLGGRAMTAAPTEAMKNTSKIMKDASGSEAKKDYTGRLHTGGSSPQSPAPAPARPPPAPRACGRACSRPRASGGSGGTGGGGGACGRAGGGARRRACGRTCRCGR